MFNRRIQKLGITMSLMVFLFVFTAGFLFTPQRAVAAGPVVVMEDLAAKAEKFFEEIQQKIASGILMSIMRVTKYFMEKVAYDTAVYLAAGAKGQGALPFKDGVGKYLEGVGESAVGVALDEMGNQLGLGSLCRPPDINVDLAIRIGLGNFYGAPPSEPNCTIQNLRDTWGAEALSSKYGGITSEKAMQFLQQSIKPSGSDLGIAVESSAKVGDIKAEAQAGSSLQRQEGQGIRPATEAISGDIKTPAITMGEVVKGQSPIKKQADNMAQLNSAFSTGMVEILPNTLDLFINTFIGQTLNNFMKNGTLFGSCVIGSKCNQSGGGGSGSLLSYESVNRVGRKEAEKVYSSILKFAIPKPKEYDLLIQLVACPDNPGPFNCVIDELFESALRQAEVDEPLTIQEAIDHFPSFLNGNMRLLPPSLKADNQNKDCYKNAFCYRNIQILRKARILPLGFEIAALYSSIDNPVTLEEVIGGFYDCGTPDVNGNYQYDSDHPYCHLINPNWVLKAPDYRCGAEGYGVIPSPLQNGARVEECADLQTCVSYDTNGECSSWGYCLEEKNSWNTEGILDTCEPQYRTCKTFYQDNSSFSYLYRTLDTSECNSNNAGCKSYSLFRDNTNSWIENGLEDLIFFDNNLAECGANAVGCTAFKVYDEINEKELKAPTEDGLLYVKKAPNYLGCYDTILNTNNNDWPTNASALYLMTQANGDRPQWKIDECSNYAGVCIEEEVGCDLFLARSGLFGLIPGKYQPKKSNEDGTTFSWNDECHEDCVGYDVYEELASNYSNGEDLAYIIPANGRQCSTEDIGCSSFTNLSTDDAGREKVEYYSYLRPCANLEEETPKNFYTYEGSAERGYELKVYNLAEGDDGEPKYFYRTQDDLAKYSRVCNEDVYKLGSSHNNWDFDLSPDCRQFNDDQAQVFYALASKAVTVSNQCTPYRLNNTELYVEPNFIGGCEAEGGYSNSDGDCEFCFQGGEYRDGNCYYYGLPSGVPNNAGTSRSCSAEVESCRTYKGATGNNIKNIIKPDEFKTVEEVQNWSNNWQALPNGSLNLSAESILVNDKSLSFTGNATDKFYRVVSDLSIYDARKSTPPERYMITFWAKGSGAGVQQILSAKLQQYDDDSKSEDYGNVNLTNDWRLFKLGPVDYKGTTSTGRVLFEIESSGVIFIDNFQVINMNNTLNLVKNSLSVGPECDLVPDDNLPGEALGCSAYTNSGGTPKYLTNFSYLCREGAVGCTALIDTKNTDDTGASLYNLWLPGTGGSGATATVNGQDLTCQVEVGKDGCYSSQVVSNLDVVSFSEVQAELYSSGAYFVSSSVYIPADTATTSLDYLIVNEEGSCSSADKGCKKAGLKQNTKDGVEYSDVFINTDPGNFENDLCTYEGVGCETFVSDGGNYYFKDPLVQGEKICEYKTGVNISGGLSNAHGWFWQGTSVPCYPTYIRGGNYHGLWSFGVEDFYEDFVGTCPEEASGCTKFTAINEDGSEENEYILENSKLNDRVDECSGQVSLPEGCVLFNKTDDPAKIYDALATYEKSRANEDKLVAPVKNPDPDQNDANFIMQMKRDRDCAKWLTCTQSRDIKDTETGEEVNKCFALGVCDSVASNGQCDNVITDNWSDDIKWNANTNLDDWLSRDVYISRNISWSSFDFSGESLFNSFQIPDLEPVDLYPENDNKDNFALAYVDEGGCTSGQGNLDTCNNTNTYGVYGFCVEGDCVYPHNGVPTKTAVEKEDKFFSYLMCRAYPEEDSPYPISVLKDPTNFADRKAGYNYVNVETGDDNLDCNYYKYNYGAGHDPVYTGLAKSDMENKCIINGRIREEDGDVCTGKESGASCEIEGVNGVTGQCLSLETVQKMNGWEGYCLERDIRYGLNGTLESKCLSWYPLDNVFGAKNVFENNPDAEYYNTAFESDQYMCLQSDWPNITRSLQIQLPDNPTSGDGYTSFHGCAEYYNNGNCTRFGCSSFPVLSSDSSSFVLGADDCVEGPYEKRFKTGGFNHQTAIYGIDSDTAPLSIIPFSSPYFYVTYAGMLNNAHRFSFLPVGAESGSILSGSSRPIYKQDIERAEMFLAGTEHFDLLTPGRIVFDFNREDFDAKAISEESSEKTSGGKPLWTSEFKILKNPDEKETDKDIELWVWLGHDRGTVDAGLQRSIETFFDLRQMSNDREHTLESIITSTSVMTNIIFDNCLPWVFSDPDKDCVGREEGNIGLALVFVDNELKGFLLGNREQKTDPNKFSAFAVLYLNPGRCSAVSQVSSESGQYSFKPVTNYLKINQDNPDDPSAGINMGGFRTFNPFVNYRFTRNSRYSANPFGIMNDFDANRMNWAQQFLLFTLGDDGIVNKRDVELEDYSGDNFVQLKAETWGDYQAGIPLRIYTADQNNNIDWGCATSNGDNALSCKLMNLMFAKLYGSYYVSNNDPEIYTDNSNFTTLDSASPNYPNFSHYTPQIAALVKDPSCTQEPCEIKLNSFMINESINETKYLPTSSDVKFSFYAWADSKQMPLRSVMINFGDSTTHKNNNISLSNYKPYCDVATNCVDDMNVPCKEDFADFCSDSSLGSGCVNNSASDPNGYNTFGSQSQYGCVADTYNVSTKYTCDVSNYLDINGQVDEDILNASPNAYDDNNKNKGGVALLKQNPDTNFAYEFELTPVARTYGLTEDDLVCVYYPRVQVADNWGWCTGNCEDTDNGRGCYEDSGYNQCSSSTALSWLYNGGVYDVDSANPIIIIPSKSTTENEEDGNEFD